MGRSHSKIYFHLVFVTKYREPKITYNIEKEVYGFIRNKIDELGCTLIAINGMPDHVHILLRGKRELSISEIVKYIKGTSSRWINQTSLTRERFEWQEGYSCFSISQGHTQRVFNYIKNQKTHHREGTTNPFIECHSNKGFQSLDKKSA